MNEVRRRAECSVKLRDRADVERAMRDPDSPASCILRILALAMDRDRTVAAAAHVTFEPRPTGSLRPLVHSTLGDKTGRGLMIGLVPMVHIRSSVSRGPPRVRVPDPEIPDAPAGRRPGASGWILPIPAKSGFPIS